MVQNEFLPNIDTRSRSGEGAFHAFPFEHNAGRADCSARCTMRNRQKLIGTLAAFTKADFTHKKFPPIRGQARK